MTHLSGSKVLFRYFLVVISCVAMISCARQKLRIPEAPTYNGPVSVDILKDFRVLNNVRSLRSEVKVKIKRGKKSLGSFKGALLFEHPSSLRLRVYSPFGSGGVDIVHHDGLLQVFVPEQGALYEGSSPTVTTALQYYMQKGEDGYKLYAIKPEDWGTSIFASYSYDKRTLINDKVSLFKDGRRFVRASFKDFIGGVPMRAKLDLFNGYTMYLDLIEPDVDVAIDADFFDFYGHGDLVVLPLERLLNEGR